MVQKKTEEDAKSGCCRFSTFIFKLVAVIRRAVKSEEISKGRDRKGFREVGVMRLNSRNRAEICLVLEVIRRRTFVVFGFAILWWNKYVLGRLRSPRRFSLLDRMPGQIRSLHELVDANDDDCKDALRMDRAAFGGLCDLLQTIGGLRNSKYVSVQEKVAMFFSILAHHTKNRSVKYQFKRSGHTVSKYFHSVLQCVCKLHSLFLVEPEPIPDDSTDPRWQDFKGCLGALDGTYIDVHVPTLDQARYRNRKGHLSVNVLGVCDTDMKFIYVLTGWEGSAADSRVLRNAVTRNSGLKVPKGVRYHLSEWSSRRPQTPQEYFNMKHTRARNIIERTFGLLKMRWGILRSPSWYPIQTHNQIIMACCLIHNYIRKEMAVDPIEQHLDDWLNRQATGEGQVNLDVIDSLDSSPEWNIWRDTLAQNMFIDWRNRTSLLSAVRKMDGSGSGGLGDGEKGKNVRSRRSWTKLEEDALVLCLIEIVNNGWKSDNGFRAGFQRELEKEMRALIPGTNLLATPHINSKIHQWKKDYGSLFDVLSKSGVGWNCTTHTLDVIDEGVWEAQNKADPHLKGMRFKSWSYYEQWQDIFGRDRATGEHAAAAIDIVNDMLRYSQTGESASVDKVCTADHVLEPVEENTPISKTANSAMKK
ncbi:hypothetical protein ACS0TY_035454 [Phlomoides rotata]